MPQHNEEQFGQPFRDLKKLFEESQRAAESRHQETIDKIDGVKLDTSLVKDVLQGRLGEIGIVAKVEGHGKSIGWHNRLMLIFGGAIGYQIVNMVFSHAR